MPRRPVPDDGLQRVIVEGVAPEIDGGRYPVKRVVGEEVVVECDLVADGHDVLSGAVLHRRPGQTNWTEVRLTPLVNDRYRAAFTVTRMGIWTYTIEAWIDRFATWARGVSRKLDAAEDVSADLPVGAELLRAAAQRAGDDDRDRLNDAAARLDDDGLAVEERAAAALDPELAVLAELYPDRSRACRYDRTLEVVVDRTRARFSAWYEFFPRSAGTKGRHGTFADAERMLPYIASLGFDVVYLPPIHPIGSSHRKGVNNSLRAEPGDPGSPWAIGSPDGGHTAVHPELGTLDDFRRFVAATNRHGMEVALDLAFQASPDHPWIREHPEWFRHRPDGSIQYAENPPKKYQDICPLDFETAAWQSLWEALRDIVRFWIDQGVRIFRVDNPHTKSLRFWEWCIGSIKEEHPDVLFLAEAFTRPKLMYALAKGGFTQSYTYFTWRRTKYEFEQYLTELTRTEVKEYFRPSFWPNTPDILADDLEYAGRGGFLTRLVLAATLTANYGIYGPAYELMENVPRPGGHEYIDNEKYQLRDWDLERPDSLRFVIQRINRIRRDNPALHANDRLVFHRTDSPDLLCYSKQTADRSNTVLVVVNLDYNTSRGGNVDLDLRRLGLDDGETYQVHDLLGGGQYQWHGARNWVQLDPATMPAHLFSVRRFLRREHDFDYFV